MNFTESPTCYHNSPHEDNPPPPQNIFSIFLFKGRKVDVFTLLIVPANQSNLEIGNDRAISLELCLINFPHAMISIQGVSVIDTFFSC